MMKQHKAQSGKSAGNWVACSAKNCRLGGMHVNRETLKQVQAWKNDSAAKKIKINDISEEDIKSYSSLPKEMKEGYANDLRSEVKAEKARVVQEREAAHIARMAQLVAANNEMQKRAEQAKPIKEAPQQTYRKLSYFNALNGESTYLSFPVVNYTREEKSGLSEFYFAVRSAAIYPDSDSRSVELEEAINQNQHIISKYHSPEDIEYVKTELKNAASKNKQAYHLREAFVEYTDDIDKNVQLGSSKVLNELTRQSKEAEKSYQLREAKKQREEDRQKLLRKVKGTLKDGENIKLPNIKVTEKMNTNESYITPMENIAKRLSSFFGKKK